MLALWMFGRGIGVAYFPARSLLTNVTRWLCRKVGNLRLCTEFISNLLRFKSRKIPLRRYLENRWSESWDGSWLYEYESARSNELRRGLIEQRLARSLDFSSGQKRTPCRISLRRAE
jgi:hypothetical protein